MTTKTASQALTFHENYGEVTRAQLAAYRKYNVSPSDHDDLVEAFGSDRGRILNYVLNHSEEGYYTGTPWRDDWED